MSLYKRATLDEEDLVDSTGDDIYPSSPMQVNVRQSWKQCLLWLCRHGGPKSMCYLIEYHLLPLAPVALATYQARFGSAVDLQVIKAKLDHSFRCKYLSEQSVWSKSSFYLHSGDCSASPLRLESAFMKDKFTCICKPKEYSAFDKELQPCCSEALDLTENPRFVS